MDHRNLKSSIEIPPEVPESSTFNPTICIVVMLVSTFPLAAIAMILTLFIQATAGLLIHIPGSIFFVLFGILFTTITWALLTTIRDDEAYFDKEPDIIREMIGYQRDQKEKEAHLREKTVQNPLLSWDGGNLSHWLIHTQSHFDSESITYRMLDKSRLYVKELRKADYHMSKALGKQMIDLLKSYDELFHIKVKTPEVHEALEKTEKALFMIHQALYKMYQSSLVQTIDQAEINIKAMESQLSLNGLTENEFRK